MGALVELGILATLLAIGFFAGRVIERNHYASIRRREKQYRDVTAFTMRFPPDRVTAQEAFLVTGTVVVSADYFKTYVAGLRSLFGGRFRSYESLMERARREALLRLKAQARRRGARLVICVRFESTSISRGWAPSIEVMAYGTALIPREEAARFVGTGRSRLLGEGSIRSGALPPPR
ncbi:MAG: YbjQ family protein [Burkholderiaceae bacterium]|jgi:uncharacterized protein YbjQ (UPF0145 family)|nr:YbjQ family protein [Burkholderiaceae bacterium]